MGGNQKAKYGASICRSESSRPKSLHLSQTPFRASTLPSRHHGSVCYNAGRCPSISFFLSFHHSPPPPPRPPMSDSVTISLLPVSLALVHVPRSRLDTLTQHVLRQILRPNPGFLNVTCNEIELSLFAEGHALQEFEKIARKDTRKLRRRREAQNTGQPGQRTRSKRRRQDWEPIEVSSDRWSVLQIDSHSDSLGASNVCRYGMLQTSIHFDSLSRQLWRAGPGTFGTPRCGRNIHPLSVLVHERLHLREYPCNFIAQPWQYCNTYSLVLPSILIAFGSPSLVRSIRFDVCRRSLAALLPFCAYQL